MTFGGSMYHVNKADFGIVIVLIDFLIIFTFLYFIYFIEIKQIEFCEEFKDQSIEMDDFTVELTAIPNDKFFSGNLHILRAYLWEYVEEIMEDQFKKNADNPRFKLNRRHNPHLTIADITYSSKDTKEIDMLTDIGKIYKKVVEYKMKAKKADLSGKTTKAVKFNAGMRLHMIRYNKKVDTYGQEYIDAKQKAIKSTDKNIMKAYVTFRSMEAKELFLEAFEGWNSSFYRRFVKLMKCCMKQEHKDIQLREIEGKWPHVKEP